MADSPGRWTELLAITLERSVCKCTRESFYMLPVTLVHGWTVKDGSFQVESGV